MASNHIIHSPLNEALELVASLETMGASGEQMAMAGSDHGWQFGGPSGSDKNREFACLILALEYVSAVRKAHGLRSIDQLIVGVKEGREDADVRLREADGSRENEQF